MKLLQKVLNVLRSKGLKFSIGKKKDEESGVALIMTLGVLSMLIVLALAFVSNAQTSSKMANSNAHNTNAKMIAEGAVQRIFAIQSLPGGSFARVSEKCGDFNYGPNDSRTGTNNYSDNTANLSTNLNPSVDDDYDDPGEYEYNPLDEISWVNVTANGKLVGRFAYVVPVDHDSVPALAPDACVTHTGDKSGSGTTAVVINAQDESTYSSKRYGVNVHEISLQSLVGLDNSLITTTHVKNLSSDSAGGTLTDGSTWNAVPPGFTLMYDGSHLNISTQAIKDKFEEEYFEIEGGLDPEAFWIDNNGNGERDEPGELYVRFNLARNDWENNWASDGLGSEGDLDGSGAVDDNDHRLAFLTDYILADAPSWSSGHADPDGKGINWFNSYSSGTDTVNGFANLIAKQKQIAANLVDYCDTDSVPTSDKDPAKWTSTEKPTFTGNDLHPMITEFWAILDAYLATDDIDNDGNVDWHYTMQMYWGAEVCNPYNVDLPGDAVVQVCSAPGAFNFNPRPTVPYGASGDYEDMGLKQEDISSAQSKVRISGPIPAGTYKSAETVYQTIFKDYEAAAGTPPVQKALCKFKYGLNTLRLLYNGTTTLDDSSVESDDTVDIAYPKTTYVTQDTKGNSDTRVVGASWHKCARVHIAVNDPRHNLNENNWSSWVKEYSWNSYSSNPYGGATSETPNSKNPSDTSAGTGDEEQQVTGANGIVSTAYIRNAPMKTPWELGAIHRAAPWETINLKKFDPQTPDVMDDYADGDINLLEQVKMTSDTELYGKFNLNTTSGDCIRALVMNVRVGTTYKDPVSGGSAVGKADADLIAASFTSGKSGQWMRRGRLGNVAALTDSSLAVTQNDDASREEIITKVINLCKAVPVDTAQALVGPTANLIIIAQAINDSGDKKVYKDLDFDGDVGLADETTVGIDLNGDGNTTSTKVDEGLDTEYERYDLNADEILSEVKIYLTIEKNAGVWSVTSKKFIE